MTEYRWYFGFGTADEFFKYRPGTYPDTFYRALGFSQGAMDTIHIYDEYHNLLHVVPGKDRILKKMATLLRREFGVRTKYPHDVGGGFTVYNCLEQLHGPKWDEAVDMIEKFILRKAEFLKHAYGHHQAAAGLATAGPEDTEGSHRGTAAQT